MEFLTETDSQIIRELVHPSEFIQDSFESIQVDVGVNLIVGMPLDKDLITQVLNPGKLMVQRVIFDKPDWTLDQALEWLQINQRNFTNYKKIKKYAADLKSIKGVEVFSAGVWNGDKYTTKDLDVMVKAFNETKDNIRPFLKLGHSEEQRLLKEEGLPAAGWIGRVYRNGEKLFADFIDIPNKIYELIENKAYRKVSSEIYLDVQIQDASYKYMLGAVALLGAEMPGVMNLSDILARFGLKDYHSIKSYAQNENNVQSKLYSIENNINKKGEPMPKSENEIALEIKLKESQDALAASKKEAKEFKTNLDTVDSDLKKAQDATKEAEKKAFEMEQKAFNTEIEKQADELVASKLISKSMRPYAIALLKNETDKETKKFSFKLDKEDKSLTRWELIKEFTSLANKTSDVNFDDNSDEGYKKDNDVDETIKIEKYAADNEVSFSDAYKALYTGKLKVERANVEDN